MRKILDFSLPSTYSTKLFNLDWNIYEKPFKETVNKLQTIEPEIKAEAAKAEAAKAKSDKALPEKVYGTKGTKRDNNGKHHVLDANKTTCKTCGKQHKGVCWDKDGGGDTGRNNICNGGNGAFNKNQMKVMNKMFKSYSSTKKDDSDSESEASADGWKKGVNLVQQMFIAQQYCKDNGMNSDEEINSIEDDQLKGLRKKARKAEKALKRG